MEEQLSTAKDGKESPMGSVFEIRRYILKYFFVGQVIVIVEHQTIIPCSQFPRVMPTGIAVVVMRYRALDDRALRVMNPG
jgi:hypothetical protein